MSISSRWVISVAILAISSLGGFAKADNVAPNGVGATTVDKPPVHVNLTESDWFGAVFGGVSYNTSAAVGFMAEAGYRPFAKIPKLSTGIDFGYYTLANKDRLIAIEAAAQWAFSEENRGLVAGLGLGYGNRTLAPKASFTVAPRVEYFLPILGDWTVGAQVSCEVLIGAPVAAVVSGFLGIRYWL